MGSHVSAVPNHQVDRITPLKTRADVAYFGTFGYELDLNKLSAEEQEEVKVYTQFMKDHRELIQHGTFYRLQSPFTCNEPAWMVVSPDRKEALVAYFRILSRVNEEFKRLRLAGLDPELCYSVDGKAVRYGDELMNAGLVTSNSTSGVTFPECEPAGDFKSELFYLKACE